MHLNKLQEKKISKCQSALLKLLIGIRRPPLFPFPHFCANNSMDVKPSNKTSGGYCFPAALETLLRFFFLQILPHVKVVRMLSVLLLPLQLAGAPQNSSVGTSVSHGHLCSGRPNPTLRIDLSQKPSKAFSTSFTQTYLSVYNGSRKLL